jgi:23S rRNA (guanosine2251-2'-O)-methyltransferase
MAAELVYGVHAVLSVLQRSPAAVVSLLLAAARGDKRVHEIEQAAQQHGISIERVERATLDRLCDGGRHQGVAARLAARAAMASADFEDFVAALPANVLILVLDGVQDPHNLGACLRSADAAGAHAVIVPRDHSAPLTPAARKVASGAAETVPLYRVANLARALDALKEQGVWLVGATHDAEESATAPSVARGPRLDPIGETLFEADLTGPTALVLGAEGSGLRRLTREACDRLVHIPMAGTVGSLNVSVAAGICLYEAVRQRRPR